MLKFNFRREKKEEFRHIAHGLMPAASIAPKPAVPRTPPPISRKPSLKRPRSAMAAAIMTSTLTAHAMGIARLPMPTRCLSEADQSKSFESESNVNTGLYTGWSEDLADQPRLSSTEHSDEEFEDRGREADEGAEKESDADAEDHVYQTLDRRDKFTGSEQVPLGTESTTPPPAPPSGRKTLSPDFPKGSASQSPEAAGKNESVKRSPENWKEDVSSLPPIPGADPSGQYKASRASHSPSPELYKMYSTVQKKSSKRTSGEQKLEERLQRLEQEICGSRAPSTSKPPAGSQVELQSLRRHAQELVDENDALKMTVHRLNVELSHYQARFRPLSKQEMSKICGSPTSGPPPPWLLDMKYFCPLLLSYEDRLSEKEELIKATEEEVNRLRVRVEETIKENKRLRDQSGSVGAHSQEECQQIQQQALVVLQENQVLTDQLETQQVQAKVDQSKYRSEVSKLTKQLMLLEAEKQHLEEEEEERRRKDQKLVKELRVLQERLKDSVTWDEHCDITAKLKRQLEQQESRNKTELEEFSQRVCGLQEENRNLSRDKDSLTAVVKALRAELDLCRQANRKVERKASVLKRQKEECLLKEEKTRLYLEAVMAAAERISSERDQLSHMASSLHQEKEGFVGLILSSKRHFGKLQEEAKVYRRHASSRLAELEESVKGRKASHQREILHLQRLLSERQEAEEKLLQSKRQVEEELELLWRSATRENQKMRETLVDTDLTREQHNWTVCGGDAPAIGHSPDLQENPPNSQDSAKHGLDFYC